jgi:APA family basic amino acid/polyamine antiporter
MSRSIILSLILSAIVYVWVRIVSIGLIPYQELAASRSPLADATEYGIAIHWSRLFVSFAAIVATVSVLLTTLIGVSRVSSSSTIRIPFKSTSLLFEKVV